MSSANVSQLTADEAAVYDRQLRVWGIDAQTRMRNSQILIIGMNGLSAEIAKNLTLAGVGSITIADDQLVQEQDLSANFFVTEVDIGSNRAVASQSRIQLLNNMCRIHVDQRSVDQMTDAQLRSYHAIVGISLSVEQLLRIDELCRSHESPIAFVSAWLFGDRGLSLTDLTKHSFTVSKPAGPDLPPINVEQSQTYPSFKHVFALTDAQLQKLAGKRQADREASQTLLTILNHLKGVAVDSRLAALQSLFVSSHCAIFGGLVAQDVLKIVSKKEEPHQNAIIYTACNSFSASVKHLC